MQQAGTVLLWPAAAVNLQAIDDSDYESGNNTFDAEPPFKLTRVSAAGSDCRPPVLG